MRFSSIFPLLTAILPGIFLSGAEKPATIGSPYGICAHLNRWEYDRMPQELKLIRQAGIRHVRTDLDWNQVEKIKGSWNFKRWDALVKEAVLNGQLVALKEGRQFAGILREQEIAFQFDNDGGIRSPVPKENALLESAFAGVGMVNGLLKAKLVIFIERVDFQFLNVADLRDLFQFSQYERIRAERAARQ